MQKNNRVVEFPYGGASFDKKNLSESLKSLPWRLRAQSLLDLMGYHESDALDGTACCAKNSHAGQMGCKTLAELCEYLGLEETDIVSELSALHLSSKKSISGDTPSDILSNHKQVVNVLGREPINSTEVMDAISYVKDNKISSLTSRKIELEDEIGVKNKKIDDLHLQVKSKEREVEEARKELSGKIESLEQSMHGLRVSHDREINDLVKRHQDELLRSNEATRQEVTREFEAKIDRLNRDHEVEAEKIKEDHQQAIDQLKHIIDQEMVSIQEFDRANLENEQLRDINRDNLIKIKTLTSKLEMLSDSNFTSLESEMSELKEKLAKLEQAYFVTQEACIKYKEVTKKLRAKLAKETEKKVQKVAQQDTSRQEKRKAKLTSGNSQSSNSEEAAGMPGWIVPVIATSVVVISYFLFIA